MQTAPSHPPPKKQNKIACELKFQTEYEFIIRNLSFPDNNGYFD